MSSWTHVPMISSGKMSLRNKIQFHRIISLTLTWFEHAPFWSGVRRATIAPQDLIASLSFCLQINIFPFWKELTCFMSSWAHVPMISSGKMSMRNEIHFDWIISLTLKWFEHAPSDLESDALPLRHKALYYSIFSIFLSMSCHSEKA